MLRPGGTLSSVGVYSGHLQIPLDGFAAGLGDHNIVTTLCPGGKERMHRLMRLVAARRIDLTPLFTHVFPLEEIGRAYELFSSREKASSRWRSVFREDVRIVHDDARRSNGSKRQVPDAGSGLEHGVRCAA